MGKQQVNCTLTKEQLEVILENDRTKAKKWVDICKELKITSNKLYSNLILLGLRCKKQKQKQNEKFFNWDDAKRKDFIFSIKD